MVVSLKKTFKTFLYISLRKKFKVVVLEEVLLKRNKGVVCACATLKKGIMLKFLTAFINITLIVLIHGLPKIPLAQSVKKTCVSLRSNSYEFFSNK
jgi:energy-converting hydrogenase Eha subunit H